MEAVLRAEYGCVPLFLPRELVQSYFRDFCWRTLWPLFHYQVTLDTSGGDERGWQAYNAGNVRFAEAVRRVYADGDSVVIHDIHLLLLPTLLRRKNLGMRIAYFIHTPWPSSEIYRVLPWRAELLRALLNCDLVGFQIFDYARHFLVCCNRLLALDTTPTSVHYYGRSVRIAPRHCSIDYAYFQKKVLTSEVQNLAARLRAAAGGRPLLLGLDSLDPLQGIVLKLLAFEAFLRDHCHDKTPSSRPVLLQIAIPRTSSPPDLSQELRRLAARINQNDGAPLRSVEEAAEALARGGSPLLYLEATVTASQRCALLSAAHVLVITSCRDGLNLLPFEYPRSTATLCLRLPGTSHVRRARRWAQ